MYAYLTIDVMLTQVYLSVPDTVIMNRDSARRCPLLGPALKELDTEFPRGDPFHEILMHFIIERFLKKDESFWKPYLDVIPAAHEMEQPIYYSKSRTHVSNQALNFLIRRCRT